MNLTCLLNLHMWRLRYASWGKNTYKIKICIYCNKTKVEWLRRGRL